MLSTNPIQIKFPIQNHISYVETIRFSSSTMKIPGRTGPSGDPLPLDRFADKPDYQT